MSDFPPVINDPSFLPLALKRAATLVCDCLEESTVNGRPAWCGLYHTTPPADCCDALLVWLDRIDTVENFPAPTTAALRCKNVYPMATVNMILYRPCWPVVQDASLSGLLAPAELESVDLQMDAVAMYCCLLNDLASDDSVIKGGLCDFASMGALTPGPPRGGCTSWKVQFKLALPPCCPMLV